MLQSFLSIIICTRNRADELNACLDLVVKQAKSFTDVEVLVIDNGSTDNTKYIVENISKQCNFIIRYIYEPIAGLCQARNRGRSESRAKILAYIDDDVRLKDQWVANIRQHFVEKSSDCLGGKVSIQLGAEAPFKLSKEMFEFFGEINYGDVMREFQETDRLPYPIGCNMAFTTDVFDAVGGFRTAFKLYGDETDFFRRTKQKNIKILYVPNVEVQQYIPAERLTKQELREKSYLHGRGFATSWLLSSPGLLRRVIRAGWYCFKVCVLALIYLFKPSFYRFFILWFYCGNIVQFLKGTEENTSLS